MRVGCDLGPQGCCSHLPPYAYPVWGDMWHTGLELGRTPQASLLCSLAQRPGKCRALGAWAPESKLAPRSQAPGWLGLLSPFRCTSEDTEASEWQTPQLQWGL